MAITLATTGVRNQPISMFTRVRRLTVLMPLIIPTPNTAPITAWEVETGTPTRVYTWTVMASAKTTSLDSEKIEIARHEFPDVGIKCLGKKFLSQPEIIQIAINQ